MSTSKPSRFLINSDYASLKRDGLAVVQTTLSGSTSIASGSTFEWHEDTTAGSAGALNLGLIQSANNGRGFHFMNAINFTKTGTVSGSPTPYSVLCFISRPSATTVRCNVQILNPYGSTLTTEASDDTITFAAYTLVAPYA
jgi:hypothetical protein